jgi:transcriptional regulator with XRE-family HTH domain
MSDKPTNAAEVVFRTGDDLSGLLRTMIDESGQTRYAIAHAAGLSESTLSRMYTGKRPTTMETLHAVAEHLGRRVVVRVE